MLITVSNYENEIKDAIISNKGLIENFYKQENLINAHDKWGKVRELYNTLSIDDPIIRSLVSLRVCGFLFDISSTLENKLSLYCPYFGERKKIYGYRETAAEKKELLKALVSAEALEEFCTLKENNWDDRSGKVANKIAYMHQFRKFSESDVNIKNLRIEEKPEEDHEKLVEDVKRILEQARACNVVEE